ncbi:MAG: hypothetical protein ACLP4V_08675 [Methylocella sp.]
MLNYVKATVASALALAALVSVVPSRAGEVAECNADAVLTTMREKMFDANQTRSLDALRVDLLREHDPWVQKAIDDVSHLTMSIENIRQVDYDAENNTRLCAADILIRGEDVVVPEMDVANKAPFAGHPPRYDISGFEVATLEAMVCTPPRGWQNRSGRRTHGVNYKIESLLDKPGQAYVSWRCTEDGG